MAATEGTTVRSDDPVLQSALSEMASEGVNLDGPVSEAEPAVSQPAAEPSAKQSAAAAPAGDPGAVPVDPLKGSEPFTYGTNRTFDGVYRFKGEGALIPEDKVPAFTQYIERAEQVQQAAQQAAKQLADFERLTEWTRTNEQGKEESFTGQQGLVELRLDYARAMVELQVYESLFKDPNILFGLLAQDEKSGEIIHNQREVEFWAERAARMRGDAETRVKSEFMQRLQPQAPSSAPDYTPQVPALIDRALAQTGIAGATLDASDRDVLARQFRQHIRTVTAQDRLYNPSLQVGSPIVSESFTDAVKHLATIRADQAKQLKAADSAGKHNAAMDKGRTPNGKKTAAPAPQTPPTDPPRTKQGRYAVADKAFEDAMGEMGIPIR